MLFDLSNYWIFLFLLAIVYVAANNFIQNNIGGKGKFKALQTEMREVQKKMTEAAKARRDKEYEELSSAYLKQTMELTQLQMKMAFVLLIPFLLLVTFVFPAFEPGTEDDLRVQLFDDGLAAHCDSAAGDGNYSGCFKLPSDGRRGAWVADAYLKSPSNETLARAGAAIYYEGGKPEDVWLQSTSQSGILDMLMGKTAYALNVSTDAQNYSSGQTVALRATARPSPHAGSGIYYEATLNSGTGFHLDLPAPLPLLNIRRIIGSNGVFIFFAFVLGIIYSIGRALYSKVSVKK
jgi:hypothetical protein